MTDKLQLLTEAIALIEVLPPQRLRKLIKELKKPDFVVVYPFNSDELFMHHWNKWKYYKKVQHNFTYKAAISEQAALDKLAKYDEHTAIRMIYSSCLILIG